MTASQEIETRLRETAEQLLRDKKVDVFLGYEKASLPFRTTPLFVTSPEQVDRLAWNPFCTINLAVYLPRLFADSRRGGGRAEPPPPPTVGIVLKGCDLRAATVLIQEHQVPREKLVIVGVACPGMVDRRKAELALGEHDALGAGEDGEGNVHAVIEDGVEVKLSREDVVAEACLQCRTPTPSMHDVLLGSPVEATDGDGDAGRKQTADFEAKAPAVRWAQLREALADCIRCSACRQACPMCYCTECVMDQTRPRWLGAGTDGSDVMIYHLTRAFHLAGRCTECGACARACPMGIDTRLLVRKMNQEVEDLYGYRPGDATDTTSPLSDFSMDDPQDFLTEP